MSSVAGSEVKIVPSQDGHAGVRNTMGGGPVVGVVAVEGCGDEEEKDADGDGGETDEGVRPGVGHAFSKALMMNVLRDMCAAAAAAVARCLRGAGSRSRYFAGVIPT